MRASRPEASNVRVVQCSCRGMRTTFGDDRRCGGQDIHLMSRDTGEYSLFTTRVQNIYTLVQNTNTLCAAVSSGSLRLLFPRCKDKGTTRCHRQRVFLRVGESRKILLQQHRRYDLSPNDFGLLILRRNVGTQNRSELRFH